MNGPQQGFRVGAPPPPVAWAPPAVAWVPPQALGWAPQPVRRAPAVRQAPPVGRAPAVGQAPPAKTSGSAVLNLFGVNTTQCRHRNMCWYYQNGDRCRIGSYAHHL